MSFLRHTDADEWRFFVVLQSLLCFQDASMGQGGIKKKRNVYKTFVVISFFFGGGRKHLLQTIHPTVQHKVSVTGHVFSAGC